MPIAATGMRHRLTSAALGLSQLVMVVSAHADTPPIAVVAAGAGDREATALLIEQLEGRGVAREAATPRDVDAVLDQVERDGPVELIVVVDLEANSVMVIRVSDGTVLSRSVDSRAARSPFAVALTGIELLELGRGTPGAPAPATAPPTRPPPPPREPTTRERVSPLPPPGWRRRFNLTVGVQQTQSFGGDVGLIQPMVGAALDFGPRDEPWWLSAGAYGAALGARERVLVDPGPAGDAQRARYSRSEGALRFAVGRADGVASAAASVDVGLARIDVDLGDSLEPERVQSDRIAAWVGIGGEVRYALTEQWALAFGVASSYLPTFSRYQVRPGPDTDEHFAAFEERALDFRLRAGLIWFP